MSNELYSPFIESVISLVGEQYNVIVDGENMLSRISIGVLCMVCVIALFSVQESGAFGIFGQHERVKAKDGVVQIPLGEVNDGKAHYYEYKHDGKEIKFFVIKSRDGVIRAAFDACDVCFPAKKGYSQDGEFMICNNCGRRFHSSQINVVEGGCNPAPLARKEQDGNLVIRVQDILPGARFF